MEPLSEIVSRAWGDSDFKARLISDPAAVFTEAGISVKEGTELRMVEDTESVRHFVLPAQPDGEELADAVLESASSGATTPGVLGIFSHMDQGG